MLQRNASIALTTRAGGDAFTGSTGRPSCGFRPLSPPVRRSVRPLPEGERDVHCGFAQLIGERTIADRTRQHHTANAQRSDGPSPVSRRLSFALQGLLENIDHGPEHGFKCFPNADLLAQKFRRQRD